MALSRRQFIKIGSTTAGVAALGSGLTTDWWSLQAHELTDPRTDGQKVVATFCELCFWKCGVLAHVRDGRVTKLVGNPKHPLSNGRLCPRGTGGTGALYDPDRLKKPMIRVSKRGEDKFEEVTWDKALDETASRMEKLRATYGAEALALFTHGYGGSWFTQLVKGWGTPNVVAPSYAQCRGPREAAFELTFGHGVGSPEAIDIRNARCITLIGSHLGENMHNTQVQELADAIAGGAQLVVVDPRFSVAASKARYWLPIKPGTDIALLLAWINVIVTEKRYDVDYIAKNAIGLAELEAHVAGKTPEWAYPLTGLHPDLIRETARFIAASRPASLIHPGRHVTWYGDDTQRLRAVAILAALLGSWGRQGGYINQSSMGIPKYPPFMSGRSGGAPADKPSDEHYPMATELLASGICDATISAAPYGVKGWMVYGTNLMQSLPNPKQTEEAIQKLDLLVAIDVLPAEIVGWADIVLPESTYLERYDDLWAASYKQPFIAVRQPVVEPMYDSKPGWWIAKELANRLGLPEIFPFKDAEENIRWRLSEGGYDVDMALRDGVLLGERVPVTEEEGLEIVFETPSEKIELFSQQLLDAGLDPLPDFTPPDEPPPGMFRLLSGRAPMHTFGRTTNNRVLGSLMDENEVWVNSTAARALAGFEDKPLATGDYVMLENQDGVVSGPVKAKVTERIRGDAVYLVHGFGHKAKGLTFTRNRGASDSVLTSRYKVDPVMGGTGMNVNFVRITRAEA
ncbi:MAG: molybdopterin-dependent oxidoreductase [Thermoanaerobaculia bacterium]|jgi:thiosulfate reductase/polysulfide reductase chain A